MALRSRLEEEKAKKQQTAAEEEAAFQAEKDQERLQEEETFRATFLKRNTLKSALEELQGAKSALKEAHGKRKGELKNILGLINEIKNENPEAEVPTVKEALAEPEEGSDEEQYVAAKGEVQTAIFDVRNKKEALANLGIVTEGLSDQEVENAVTEGLQQSQQEVRNYVREHADSALPEAQEVKAEMVREAEDQFLPILNKSVRRATESFAGSLEDYKVRLTEDESAKKREILQYVSEGALKYFLQDKKSIETALEGLQKMKHASGEDFGPIEAEALAGALKLNLLGITIDSQGERILDLYHTGTLNEKKSKLKFLLKDEAGNIPEGFFYDDNSGVKAEGLLELSSQIESTRFNQSAENLLRLVAKKEELENLPEEQKAVEAKAEARTSKRREAESLRNQEQNALTYIRQTTGRIETLEEAKVKLQILKADPEYAASSVSVRLSYGKPEAIIKVFKDALDAEWNIMAARRQALEAEKTTAQADYRAAQSAKRGLFNKKELANVEETARQNSEAAIKRFAEIENDAVFSESKTKSDQIREKYQLASKQIEEVVSGLNIPQDGFSGENFQAFQTQIEGAIASKIATEVKEKTRQETELEKIRETQKTLTSEIEALNQDLRMIKGSAEWRDINEYFQERRQRIQRDQEALLQAI